MPFSRPGRRMRGSSVPSRKPGAAVFGTREVAFEPLENGLDYMLSVVEHLSGVPDSRDLKYAILHLAAAIEVLLKSRLAAEHWTLILSKLEGVTSATFDAGDFQSVDARVAIGRLRAIVGISITDEDERNVKSIVEKRNRLQHHGLVDSAASVRAIAYNALNFLITFLDQHVQNVPHYQENVSNYLGRIRPKVLSMGDFVRHRLDNLQQSLDAFSVVVTCPTCSQVALVLDDPCHCYFCGATGPPSETAESYVENVLGQSQYLAVKDGEEWDLYDCPSCGLLTLVEDVSVRSRREQLWVCFAESLAWSDQVIRDCPRCGCKTLDDDLCANCASEVLSRD
jgi:rRNA maturation protein Nop10